jgi:nucleoside-diphosphate-sugar epimerase
LKKIALFGASGFVGAHFYERSQTLGRDQTTPIIHSTGNAWRLARWGAPLRVANLLNKDEIAQAMEGCTHVVNCSRGDDAVMLRGLANLLEVSVDRKIEGFVHLSSVMVYGDPPSLDSVTESGTIPSDISGYGATKLKQDQMVIAAAKDLPSAILCPPNITGAYSQYIVNLINAIKNKTFALMDDGSAPCVIVDVDNLCHAIEQALDHCSKSPQRLFITDDEPTTWAMLTDSLMEFTDGSQIAGITESELRALRDRLNQKTQLSLIKSLKHLVSSDVREAIKKDPLLAKVDVFIRNGVALLGPKVEGMLRLSLEGTPTVPRLPQGPVLNARLTAQQLRGVRHSCEMAKRNIGYQPRSFKQSMEAFRRWYRCHYGMDSGYWDLLRHFG